VEEQPVADDFQEDIGAEFDVEDELELLRSNTLAMALGTISFLRAQGIPATEWARSLGEIFARGWDSDEAWSPEDFLDATIVNLTAFGGEAVQAEFSEDEAIAMIADFPDPRRVEGLGLDAVEGDLLYDLIGPIALACGVWYHWERQGEHVRITIRPAPVL
jgi:hypothetical protein